MRIPFTKMHGAGNDFVVLDSRDESYQGIEKRLAEFLCDRHLGVGGDGLILLDSSTNAHFSMRYFNRDGSQGEACGNGARCIALFANRLGIVRRQLCFESVSGMHYATLLDGGSVRLDMPDLSTAITTHELSEAGHRYAVHQLDVGVPHAVLIFNDVDKVNVENLGRRIRYHRHFQPRGANVNFVEVLSPQHLKVRTFERGVEAETLACGTGAIASAIVTSRMRMAMYHARVETSGGDFLEVTLEEENGSIRSSLTGPATIAFQGEIEVNEKLLRIYDETTDLRTTGISR